MATALGIKEYDAVTKDLARASYVVPRDYILYCDEVGLFADHSFSAPINESEKAASISPDIIRLALPPHVFSVTSESDSDTIAAGLCYRGIPYADIVQQLMLSIGAADGAEVGERNTVYFSLAVYMRYICVASMAFISRHIMPFSFVLCSKL